MLKRLAKLFHAAHFCNCRSEWPFQEYCRIGLEEKRFRTWEMMGLGYVEDLCAKCGARALPDSELCSGHTQK